MCDDHEEPAPAGDPIVLPPLWDTEAWAKVPKCKHTPEFAAYLEQVLADYLYLLLPEEDEAAPAEGTESAEAPTGAKTRKRRS